MAIESINKRVMLVRIIYTTDIPKKKEFDTHWERKEGSPEALRDPLGSIEKRFEFGGCKIKAKEEGGSSEVP